MQQLIGCSQVWIELISFSVWNSNCFYDALKHSVRRQVLWLSTWVWTRKSLNNVCEWNGSVLTESVHCYSWALSVGPLCSTWTHTIKESSGLDILSTGHSHMTTFRLIVWMWDTHTHTHTHTHTLFKAKLKYQALQREHFTCICTAVILQCHLLCKHTNHSIKLGDRNLNAVVQCTASRAWIPYVFAL